MFSRFRVSRMYLGRPPTMETYERYRVDSQAIMKFWREEKIANRQVWALGAFQALSVDFDGDEAKEHGTPHPWEARCTDFIASAGAALRMFKTNSKKRKRQGGQALADFLTIPQWKLDLETERMQDPETFAINQIVCKTPPM